MKFKQMPSVTVSRRDAIRVASSCAVGALGTVLPALAPGLAQAAGYGSSAPKVGSATRLALLVGNRVYPSPFDLPPVHKNVRDLKSALEGRGFKVTSSVDQDPDTLRRTAQAFAKEVANAPPDATVLFYFTGHGMQIDAENLLLGAGMTLSEASLEKLHRYATSVGLREPISVKRAQLD